MGVAKELPPIPTVFAGSNARRAGRVRMEMVSSTLGEVLDLSATGARIRCSRKPDFAQGSELSVELDGIDGPFAVQAKVAWIRRAGLRKHEAGLEFVEPTDEVRKQLAALARTAPMNETFHRALDFKRSA
jgi:hypothetical protein